MQLFQKHQMKSAKQWSVMLSNGV